MQSNWSTNFPQYSCHGSAITFTGTTIAGGVNGKVYIGIAGSQPERDFFCRCILPHSLALARNPVVDFCEYFFPLLVLEKQTTQIETPVHLACAGTRDCRADSTTRRRLEHAVAGSGQPQRRGFGNFSPAIGSDPLILTGPRKNCWRRDTPDHWAG
jgi:hypothetical protein